MTHRTEPTDWLLSATVVDGVFALRPDYRLLLLTADGLRGGDSDEVSKRILADAETSRREFVTG